jgi:hypothetical protein
MRWQGGPRHQLDHPAKYARSDHQRSAGEYWPQGQSKNYRGPSDVERHFWTLNPEKEGGSGFGSLFHHAKAKGYAGDPHGPIDYLPGDAGLGDDDAGAGGIKLENGATSKMQKIEWLWKGWLERGKVVMSNLEHPVTNQ